MIGHDMDWNLPRLTLNHNDLPNARTHAIGKTHTLVVKAKKTNESEDGSTYKITHVEAAKGKMPKRYLINRSKSIKK